MKLKDHDDSVSRHADTDTQSLNAADTKRVLATARALQKENPEMLDAWLRAVDPEAARVVAFWRESLARNSAK